MSRPTYTREQVVAMAATVKKICDERGIEPASPEGNVVATQVINEANRGEALADITRRLRLH